MIILIKGLNLLMRKIDSFKVYIHKTNICNDYDIHKSVGMKYTTRVLGAGKIYIKEGTYIGSNSFIVSHPKSSIISIGKNCMISHDVHIRTAQYDTKTLHLELNKRL